MPPAGKGGRERGCGGYGRAEPSPEDMPYSCMSLAIGSRGRGAGGGGSLVATKHAL